jgi:RNase P/RNase MRP subunit POP5
MQFNEDKGIIRCAHYDQHKVVDLINQLCLKDGKKPCFSTQGCSGTIRALRKKHEISKK